MLIGLTGGIASGKSLVSGELKRLGARIIDADVITREITSPGQPANREIIEEFGPEAANRDGTINRQVLGGIVFSDPEKLSRLNRITHPRIIQRIGEKVEEIKKENSGAFIVIDAALLYEVGLQKGVSKVIVVYADEEKQIKRLMKRDCLSEEDAKKRINAQMPLKLKAGYADYVINNNGEMEEARRLAARIYEELKAG